MQELTDIQKLAVAAALEKQIKKLTDKRAVDSLGAVADEDLRCMFEETGVDRIRIRIGGIDVGTMSITMTKPVKGEEMRVEDARALAGWLRETDEGADVLAAILTDLKVQQAVSGAAMGYGFMPDGCRLVEVDEPARVKGTMLRVDAEKVAKALKGELPQHVAGLLENGGAASGQHDR